MATTQKALYILSSDFSVTATRDPIRRKFGVRAALFFSPMAALLIIAAASLFLAGELMTPEQVIREQMATSALYYPRCQPRSVYPKYKLMGATLREPTVLVLGSSRMNSLRSEFLSGPRERFYNANVWGADVVGYLQQFLRHLPQAHLPHTIIVGIDPWWFRGQAPVEPAADFFDSPSVMEILDFGWRTGLWWTTQKAVFSPPGLIGITARQLRLGIRQDGSFFPGTLARPQPPKVELEELQNQAAPWFERSGSVLSASALSEFERFLEYCAAHNMTVIGYFPPLHPSVYEAVRATPGLEYYREAFPAVAARLNKFGFPAFDFQNPGTLGCTVAEFMDGSHETEVCTARAVLAMANADPHVGSIFRTQFLEQAFEHRSSEWLLGL